MMRYKVSNDFIMKQIADESVVIPRGKQTIEFGKSLVFNETGAFLWEMLKEPLDVDTLAKALNEKYSVDFDIAVEDVSLFIEKMNENGLLVAINE